MARNLQHTYMTCPKTHRSSKGEQVPLMRTALQQGGGGRPNNSDKRLTAYHPFQCKQIPVPLRVSCSLTVPKKTE